MAASASSKVQVPTGSWVALAVGKANVHLQALGSNEVKVCFAGAAPANDADPGSFILNAEDGLVSFTGMDAAQNVYAKGILSGSNVAVMAY